MLFTVFDNFLTNEEIKPDNKIYITVIGGIFIYLCIIVLIKNLIHYFSISDNMYWIIIIIIILDLTMYINQHKEFIERKIKELIPKKNPIPPPPSIDEIKENELEKGLILDEIKEDEYTSVVV